MIPAVQQLRKDINGNLFRLLDPDSLYFFTTDFVTFGFTKEGIGIAARELNHMYLLETAKEESPDYITWMNRPADGKLPPEAQYNVRGRAGFKEYNSRTLGTVMVPCITFWEKEVEKHPSIIDKSIELVRKVDPKLPPKGPDWYIGLYDKMGWLDEIERVASDERRAKEVEAMKQIHMLPPEKKKQAMKDLGIEPTQKTFDVPAWKRVIGDSKQNAEDKLIAEHYLQIYK